MRLAPLSLLILPLTVHGQPVELTESEGLASGYVYEDKNRNGKRDPKEKGIPDV